MIAAATAGSYAREIVILYLVHVMKICLSKGGIYT
jgi:hypothetical protein